MNGRNTMRTILRNLLFCGAIVLLPSFAGATDIELASDRRQPREKAYNIKLGSLSLDLGARLTAGYDDNITLSAHNDDIDEGFYTEPALTMDVNFETPYMHINAGIGIGYRYYTGNGGNTGEDGIQLTGEEGAASARFDVDFLLSETDTLTFAETFSRTVDSIETDNSRDNQPDASSMENILELLYNKELSELMTFKARLARTDAWWSRSYYDYLDHHVHSADAVLLWKLNSTFQLGPYARWEKTIYDGDQNNDSEAVEGGLAFVYKPGSGFTLDGSVGIENLNFDSTNSPTATDDGTDVTGELGLVFATSEYATHRLSASYGRTQGDLSPSFNYADELTAGYSIALALMKDLSLFANADWVHSEESDGGEEADFLRFGIGTEYQITSKTTMGVRYERVDKASDDDDREFSRNLVELNLSHSF